ncbi:hypothetical protein ACWPKO_02170 [Coraliomargarita sp. W4R53]
MKKFLNCLFFLLIASASFSFGQSGDESTEIFLQAIPGGFEFIDMDQDDLGNTYYVGRLGSSTLIYKFDTAGIRSDPYTINSFSAVAVDVGSNGYLYIVSTNQIRRVNLNTENITSASGTLGMPVSGMRYKDVVYVAANQTVVAVAENPGSRWPRFIRTSAALSGSTAIAVEPVGFEDGGGAWVRAASVDGDGNVYMVGEGSAKPQAGFLPDSSYVAKLSPSNALTVKNYAVFEDIIDVHARNGWVYFLGLYEATNALAVVRVDSGLSSISSSFNALANIVSPTYSEMLADHDGRKTKFRLAADGDENLYVLGYLDSGITHFVHDTSELETFAVRSSTEEVPFIAKLGSDFLFDWVKTPVQSPFSQFGSRLSIGWDGLNQRLWLGGSYFGSNGLAMQEGSDAGSRVTLSAEPSPQGFAAVFDTNSDFAEVVKLTIDPGEGQDRVLVNNNTLDDEDRVSRPIVGSVITIRSPRTIYQYQDGNTLRQTDNIEAFQNTIDNADTRFTFINFSVNSVVEDSDATVYTFTLDQETEVKLEWLTEYALNVSSNFADTESDSKRPGEAVPFINALTSTASGNPTPTVGKHWIEGGEPVVLQIDGYVQDLGSYPGLNIRYVPYGYIATGPLNAVGTGTFTNYEGRQQLPEFSMTNPVTVKYQWKLQYGVDLTTSNQSAGPLLAVDFRGFLNSSGTLPVRDEYTNSIGAGVHWYDDGSIVRIAAPREINFDDGPQGLKGWLNGDGNIFNPTQGSFDLASSSLFTSEQIDSGFLTYDFFNGNDTIEYVAKEIVLNFPARVVWNFGDSVILKTVGIGGYVGFTSSEISDFNLDVLAEPGLSAQDPNEPVAADVATPEDFIWDPTGKKFFPVRPTQINLDWPTTDGNFAKVRVTSVWQNVNYQHIANTPAVSLVSRPPVGAPLDFVFEDVAYTTNEATVDDDVQFTATGAGRTVLEFRRIAFSGRGGVTESVVELKVVETRVWNNALEATRSVEIGQKITSPLDLAGLGTGYVFFDQARYNPFVYDRDLFIGDALWNADTPPGPVIPVNQHPTASSDNNDDFVIVWYDNPSLNDYLLWPYAAERFVPQWPAVTDRILMSSRFGSESVDAAGNDQQVIGDILVDGQTVAAATTFDPSRFEQVQIYNQPDRNLAGFNPNEEHALMAPSLRFAAVAPRPNAAYAMRENDLNNTSRTANYSSDPYVLVQFLDKADNEFKMKLYHVVREDLVNYPDGFSSEMAAGEPVIPYYPIGVVSGATLCASTYAREGDPSRLTFWRDHKETAWAVSGDGEFSSFFYYPLTPNFWWPDASKSIGDCVAWLPDLNTELGREAFTEIDYTQPDETPAAQGVTYTTVWPLEVPFLKVGETLTFAGGEYAADNSDAPGLPGVLAWAAGEVIFDELNPDMREGTGIDQDGNTFDKYTARMFSALEERRVALNLADFPAELKPAGGRTDVDGTVYKFNELSSSLKKRIFYDPLTGELGIKGFVNDKDIADDTLTASPPAVYVLESNILTQTEYEELRGDTDDSPFSGLNDNDKWTTAVDLLFHATRNPNQLSQARVDAANGYTAGLQVQTIFDPNADTLLTDQDNAEAYQAKGPGLALVANPAFLDPDDTSLPNVSYVTLAENNDPALGGSPVLLHVIKIDRRERYRGAVKVVLSDNVFDENIILRHTGDFGGMADDLVFDWWYRVEDGTDALPPDAIPAGQTNPWSFFPDPSPAQGEGFSQLKLKGNPQAPELLLADSLWFVRYRHKNEVPASAINWAPEITFQWAGAGNSTPQDLDADGTPDYLAQLAQGWIKRVLDAVNPYEARISDFNGDSPATYSSMIQQFGARYEGPVALNPDKNVIENVGLIELYSTVLKRGRDLSIDLSTPISTPGITNALLLAATRLADFYMLLGNEAYTDAKNPSIGFGSDSVEYGSLAPTVFTFQNQLSSKIEEELGLLRGVYDFKARPVYNRLFWNFTKGEGEAAYALAYNISDITEDGFINEDDAMVLYPQGHGDAWGHYLTAIRGQYELLNNPFFSWVSRSELYNLQDIVIEVDFLDERKFAQVAAAKARTGADIIDLTYRESYVADPEAQWQGYIDSDDKRAWGVEGWSRRAGQAAYFDWVTANALIPSQHPNSSYTGIRKVDRTTVKDIAVISANLGSIQQTFEEANNGYNPLGLAGNAISFDIDPTFLQVGSFGTQGESHFEQMYGRAVAALNNAVVIFDHANELSNMLRSVANTEAEFRREVFEEDLAYRNDLIEIFGTPYAGTIGSAGAFPAGYQGPDTSLYMYVDQQVREISANTVPSITTQFSDEILDIPGSYSNVIKDDFRASFTPTFQEDSPSDWLSGFGDLNYILTEDDGISFDSENSRVKLGNINLPIKASGYTFQADEEWGARATPGELQMLISEMIQQEANVAAAIAAWDGFQGGLVRQLRLLDAQIEMDDSIRKALRDQIIYSTVLGAASLAGNITSGVFEDAADIAGDLDDVASSFTPTTLPTGGLAVSPGDALSALRGAIGTGVLALKGTLLTSKSIFSGIADGIDLSIDLADLGIDFDIDRLERDFELKSALVELENMAGDEAILRIDIYREIETLRQLSDEYRALLQKGARLIDEREAYNKRVAELVQQNRYQDMSFRVARNAALQRYEKSFELAARYCYMAAKAFDYELNLDPVASGSPVPIMTEIVRQRGLGFVDDDGVPQIGKGGLSEQLAILKGNFEVLEGQLGINAPQTEAGRFSLREELFRISGQETSDGAWTDALATTRVDNLWDLPEFRRYCRPFSVFDPEVAEPGIVIEFSSEITSRKNFFGLPLAGGDNAYDPTNFSTKVFSVGAWFEGYLSSDLNTGLSETPRIYLVPVGTDIMAYPSDLDLGVRRWDVLDQKVPIPYPVQDSNLSDAAWRPLDSLDGLQGEIRRFSSFRAYHDSGFFDESEMTFDTRLVGRSVWNTRWLLIIPGSTLKADPDSGLDTFIENITDIKLFFQTYGFSGN